MMLVRSDERKNRGPPDPKLMEAIGKLTEEMNLGIELARRFMQAHADALGTAWHGEVEVRQLADFEPERA
jgi:hypothetical protein